MRPDTHAIYQERLLRVLVHVQNHLDEALCLEDLAEVACFSPYHFHRVFRGMVGESLMEYVRRLRLERAALRLKTTDQPVTRIAFEAGYETHEAFTRAFRAMFEDSPSGYRERQRSADTLPTAAPGSRATHAGVPAFTGGCKMEVRIEQVQPIHVAFVRHVGPYAEVGAAWNKLCAWAGPRGLLGPGLLVLGLCHDDPEVTPPDRIRYDACIAVGDDVQPEGEIGIQDVAGGEYAVTVHRGPYERLADTYAAMCGQWMPGSGRQPRSSPSFEIYHNSPETTPPEQLITEVHVPLEPLR